MAKKYLLHLMHQSLEIFDPDQQTAGDVEFAFKELKPDIISWTEIGDLHSEIHGLCRKYDYHPIFYANAPREGFAFNPDVVKLKSKGSIVGSEADPNAGFAARAKRHILWAQFKLDDETIWYHTGHWLPGITKEQSRVPRHNAMSRQMAAQVRKHARGGDISFFSGDINTDDEGGGVAQLNEIFRTNGLLTIWDEFKVYPGTLSRHKTIDVIGSYNPDKQVTGKRYKAHAKRSSDHRAISAWYEIERTRVAQPSGTNGSGSGSGSGGGTGGGTGPDPVQDDFYATGGNIDWSDYFDGAIFNLPQAVDDSDDVEERFGVSD